MASPDPPVSQYASLTFPRSAIPSVIGACGGSGVLSRATAVQALPSSARRN